ncbi:glycosyl hydrolase family 18 protein [Bacillus licheniformis]|nr:glycosyl hydrolase family 18 protein [Bacillus licheniformis]
MKRYKEAGVKGDKLVLGTPFYGRGWSGCEPGGTENIRNADRLKKGHGKGRIRFSDLERNYVNQTAIKVLERSSKSAVLYNAEMAISSLMMMNNHSATNGFIKANGLSGAMFWDFSGDSNRTLLNKLAADLDLHRTEAIRSRLHRHL